MQRLSPFTVRQRSTSIVQLYIILVNKQDERTGTFIWATKPKYDQDTLLITGRQRTMETLKAIRNTWDKKNEGSRVNLSHMEHFFTSTTPSTTPPPHLVLAHLPDIVGKQRDTCETQSTTRTPNNLCCFGRHVPLLYLSSWHPKHLRMDKIMTTISGRMAHQALGLHCCWQVSVESQQHWGWRGDGGKCGGLGGGGSYHSREPVLVWGVKQLTERHCTTDASTQRRSCTFKSKNVLLRMRGGKSIVTPMRVCVCVRCQGTGCKRYPTLSRAAKNISWCVYKKRNVLIGVHRAERESQLARGLAKRSRQNIYMHVSVCLSVCVYSWCRLTTTVHRGVNADSA